MVNKEPTPEQARGWLNQRVGKYHKAVLFEVMEDIKDEWINGGYLGDSQEETIQRNAEALGQAQMVAKIILTLDEMCVDKANKDDENY